MIKEIAYVMRKSKEARFKVASGYIAVLMTTDNSDLKFECEMLRAEIETLRAIEDEYGKAEANDR